MLTTDFDISPDSYGQVRQRRPVDHCLEMKIHFEELSTYLAAHLVQLAPSPRPSERRKLERLTRQQFYELSTDVHDELVRRKNEAPFPLREDFNWKRHQARQKLADLPDAQFRELCSGIWSELIRQCPELKNHRNGEIHSETLQNDPSSSPQPHSRNQTPPVGRRSKEPKRNRVIKWTRDNSVTLSPQSIVATDGTQEPATSGDPQRDYRPSADSDLQNASVGSGTTSASEKGQICLDGSHERMRMYYEYKIATVQRAWKDSVSRVKLLENDLVSVRKRAEDQSLIALALGKELNHLRETREREKERRLDNMEELQILRDQCKMLKRGQVNWNDIRRLCSDTQVFLTGLENLTNHESKPAKPDAADHAMIRNILKEFQSKFEQARAQLQAAEAISQSRDRTAVADDWETTPIRVVDEARSPSGKVGVVMTDLSHGLRSMGERLPHARTLSDTSTLTLVDDPLADLPSNHSHDDADRRPSSDLLNLDEKSNIRSSGADKDDSGATDRIESDEAWAELKLYVHAQSSPIAYAVQAVLSGVRCETPPPSVKESVAEIITIVSSIVACCRDNIPQAYSRRGNDLLNELSDHAHKLAEAQSVPDATKESRLIVVKSSLDIVNAVKGLMQL